MTTTGNNPGVGGELYEADEADDLDTGEIIEPTEQKSSEEDGVALRPNTLIPEHGIFGYRNRSRAQTVVSTAE